MYDLFAFVGMVLYCVAFCVRCVLVCDCIC